MYQTVTKGILSTQLVIPYALRQLFYHKNHLINDYCSSDSTENYWIRKSKIVSIVIRTPHVLIFTTHKRSYGKSMSVSVCYLFRGRVSHVTQCTGTSPSPLTRHGTYIIPPDILLLTSGVHHRRPVQIVHWRPTNPYWYWDLLVATERGGTHPTGMLPCCEIWLQQRKRQKPWIWIGTTCLMFQLFDVSTFFISPISTMISISYRRIVLGCDGSRETRNAYTLCVGIISNLLEVSLSFFWNQHHSRPTPNSLEMELSSLHWSKASSFTFYVPVRVIGRNHHPCHFHFNFVPSLNIQLN